MAEVYWSFNADNINTDLIIEKPCNALVDLKKNKYFKGLDMKVYSKCSALPEYFKNVLVIKSLCDFTLRHEVDVDGNVVIKTNKPQKFFDDNIQIETYEKEQQVIQLNWNWYFFSEEKIEISITPAFMHENNFTKNTTFLPGKMNISKWFRPIRPGFKMDTSEVNVKRGDALFYVHFNTDEKIDLKHFKWDGLIANYQSGCLHVKNLVERLSLKKLYDMFEKRNFNKKIMKEIKKNLTGDFE